MKLLKVLATGYKNCADNFEINMVPIARKTSEDKEYELQEITDGLYVYSTVGIVGKNASGKTSAVELLSVAHEILSNFRIVKKSFSLDGTKIVLYFYHEGSIYKYETKLVEDIISNSIIFAEQNISAKIYYKSKANEMYDDRGFVKCEILGVLPEDTSIVFFILKGIHTSAIYFNCLDVGSSAYRAAFSSQRTHGIPDSVLMKIIKIFDENISKLELLDDNNYEIVFCGEKEKLSAKELYYRLSSGTTKGIVLYTIVVMSLINGFDLIIDEIENHFHKTLVENIVTLYKDKSINRKNASLIFTTHYCEILDVFGRQDNIYITKSDKKVNIFNMYRDFDVRPELLKSKQFYNDVFKTAVNYDALMDLKKELK